jgi:hypothetical protein
MRDAKEKLSIAIFLLTGHGAFVFSTTLIKRLFSKNFISFTPLQSHFPPAIGKTA